MITKIFVAIAIVIAAFTLTAGFGQQAAVVLRQEQQTQYWPRRGTQLSGVYQGNRWVPSSVRSSYSNFRGGGPASGK